ncbi:MAG: 3-hydroxyacyl-ACP dehydratase FabZ [Desulfuromonadia bacterium]
MEMSIQKIMEVLPHRYPFLLIDRVLDVDPGKRIVAIKNVSVNEPQFTGHFPGAPVMPGVLIIEAMAQAAGIMAYLALDEASRNKLCYFVSIDNAKFRRPVIPGDQLRIEVELSGVKRGIWGVAAKAFVGDRLVTEAELKATFAERE